MTQPYASGICLDAASVRDEINDVLHNGVDAHGLDNDAIHGILALSDPEINAVINNVVDDDFWAAYDSARSDAISSLADLVRKRQNDWDAVTDLDEDQQEALDELTHDTASQIASNAINSGEQVDFLLANGWSLDQVVAALPKRSASDAEED